ncbi:thiamine biosynthesis protein ThiS [Amycolatopsis antarctica]|uniref:Thiamine biosynthesis protein ThiS n=1 Tax=Amycolatopsis antarctica TaxID=1854586 RepID=A0A263CYD8_9PSEU|nr:sulfur carrier protein ThiS [Amycolatopsis antarctica]OZM70989.1 thiamine biosynthesis protein ThiS [Amycolatopsis antarctica]
MTGKTLRVNGNDRDFAVRSTLAEVLGELGAAQRGVAVALDGEVVGRSRWAEIVPADGSRLDVLTAVQGG